MKVRSRILWSALTVVIASGAYVGLLPSDPSVPKAAAVTVPTLNVPAGFTATPILGSTGSSTPRFTNPTAVRFAPDGRVFVAEKTGVITVFLNVNATTGTTFADLSGEVMDYWDRGLIGLAVDPQLLTGRPYVYVSYTDDLDPSHAGRHWGDSCPTPPGATTDGCTVTNRIARLTVSNNGAGNTMVAGSEKILIDGWCQQFPSHSIGDIRIGSDGNLWATGGEGGSFDSTDTGDKGGTLTGSPNSTIQARCARRASTRRARRHC
jgi:glucose/arabinose dehydrogenase